VLRCHGPPSRNIAFLNVVPAKAGTHRAAWHFAWEWWHRDRRVAERGDGTMDPGFRLAFAGVTDGMAAGV